MTESDAGASPNSIRYFYPASRAHHAHCMAVDFGMEFEQRSGKWPLEGLKHIDPASNYRIYIHPDSIPLLELQAGDFVSNTHCPANRKHRACSGYIVGFLNRRRDAYVDKGERHNGKDAFCEEVKALRIIQRNGLAFHWPESEAA